MTGPSPLGITRRETVAETHFTMTPVHWSRTTRLSYRAKGILVAIASHEPGYQLTMAQLIRQSRDGRDAVRAGVKELELEGYLVLTVLRDDRGRNQGYAIELVEDPHEEGPQRITRSGRDQQERGKPAGQNRSGFTAAATPQRAIPPEEEHYEKTTYEEDQKLASEPRNPKVEPRPHGPDKVDRVLTAAGLDPGTHRDRISAYLAEQGKGLGVLVAADRDGTARTLLANYATWARPTPAPPPIRGLLDHDTGPARGPMTDEARALFAQLRRTVPTTEAEAL